MGLCHSKSVELETELYHSEMVVRESMLCIEMEVRAKALYYIEKAARGMELDIDIGKEEQEMALYAEKEEREMVLYIEREEREMVLDGCKVLAQAI